MIQKRAILKEFQNELKSVRKKHKEEIDEIKKEQEKRLLDMKVEGLIPLIVHCANCGQFVFTDHIHHQGTRRYCNYKCRTTYYSRRQARIKKEKRMEDILKIQTIQQETKKEIGLIETKSKKSKKSIFQDALDKGYSKEFAKAYTLDGIYLDNYMEKLKEKK